MNPRQRRGALLLVLSVLGAVAVFGATARYTAGVARQLGPSRPVLVLARDVPPWRALVAADVRVRQIPAVWAPATALGALSDVARRVPGVPLRAGSLLQRDVLVPVPAARPGERSVTVAVGLEAGVAASVRPEDLVDIVAAYRGNGGRKPYAEVVVARVRLLAVERLADDRAGTGGLRGDTRLAVTLALTPAQVTKVVLAQSVAEALRLALVPPGEPAPGGTR